MNLYCDRPDKDACKLSYFSDDFYNMDIAVCYRRQPWWKFWVPRYRMEFMPKCGDEQYGVIKRKPKGKKR